MRVTASKLRENVYRILDRVAETGRPVEIVRNGKVLRIVLGEEDQASVQKQGLFDRLIRRNFIQGDPKDLVHLDWASEWKP